MKKKLLVLLVLMSILFVPAYAAEPKVVSVMPAIKFDGTEATCSVLIVANKSTDTISATMELWLGDKLVNCWSGTGTHNLAMNKTATVAKGKTYDLVINYAISGSVKVPVSISKTNN